MRKKWLFVLVALAICVAVYVAFVELMTEPVLTEAEMIAQVEQAYAGQVQNIVEKQEGHYAFFLKDGSTYEVVIDAKSGKMQDLQLIYQGVEQEVVVPEAAVEEPPLLVSPEDATTIALQEFDGQVESVEYVRTTEGGYYLVEIEQGEQEAVVQVHAITGKMLSIQYDD